jgi:hypothetical protein
VVISDMFRQLASVIESEWTFFAEPRNLGMNCCFVLLKIQ